MDLTSNVQDPGFNPPTEIERTCKISIDHYSKLKKNILWSKEKR